MAAPPLDGEQALRLLATMWRIRLFEERVGAAQARRRGPRPDPPERRARRASPPAVCTQLRDDDAVYSRPPGARARDREGRAARPRDGRADGPRRRAVPRASAARCTSSTSSTASWARPGVVGGNIPIALGSALAARLRGDDCGRGRLLRRRRGAGGPLQRDGQPRDALGAAADPRVREQRLRGVHAALGAHDRRARQRRRRALRARARRPSTATTSSRSGRRSAASSRRRATGRGPFLLECLTHRLRGHYEGDPGAVPRGARRGGLAGRRTRSCGCSAAASRRAGSARTRGAAIEAEAAEAVEAAVRVRAREPVPAARADRGAGLRAMPETTYIKAITGDARRGDARRRARVRARRGRRRGRPVHRDRRPGRGVRRASA